MPRLLTSPSNRVSTEYEASGTTLVAPATTPGTPDTAHLRSILRGFRSHNAEVRGWALSEAYKLDDLSARLLDGLVERSFKDERGRRRFWRFLSFWVPYTAVGFAFSLLPHRMHISGAAVSLVPLALWVYLWRRADRSATRAFAPRQDGRTEWQKARKETAQRAGTPDRFGTPPPAPDLRPTSPVARAVAAGMARGERPAGARNLATDDLVDLARELMAAYERISEPEDEKRAKFSNWAFWVFLLGIFSHATWMLGGAAVLGLYTLHYRDPEGRRVLEALAWVLELLRTDRGVSVSALELAAAPDLTLLARMRRRCPALAQLLPDAPLATEEARPLTDEERSVLKQLSAEVLLSPLEHVEDTLTALERLETVGDAGVLPVVQRLAAWPARPSLRTPPSAISDYVRDARRIRSAAQQCLAVLRARPDVQERILLRASQPPAPEDTLLRPADLAPREVAPETLLRPVDADPAAENEATR